MRKIKYSFPYQRYVTDAWAEHASFFQQLYIDRSVFMPGNVLHNHPRRKIVLKNRQLNFNNYTAWDRHKEQVLYRLYWRLHPNEK